MATINGAVGNQTLNGTPLADTISGLDGHDTIAGGAGDDRIYGHSVADLDPASGTITATLVTVQASNTLAMARAPGDPSHLYFLAQTTGVITAYDLNTGTNTTFLDIDNATFSSVGEQGVLSLAFHPNYASNGRFFVNLTRPNGDIEIREYARSGGNPLQADPASARTILTVPHPVNTNHNGGQLLFGPNDGMLYLGYGDGGAGNDPNNNAQNVNSLLGKLIRIDVNSDDFPADATRNYHIPAGNPFIGINGADEIWAIGLRNPFRMSFDTNGDLYIGDVGQLAREEIDFLPAGVSGRNFGWRIREGTLPNIAGTPPPEAPTLTDPVFDYPRDVGATVIGGFVHHGPTPGLQGGYIFSDFGSGRYFTLTMVGGSATAVVELTDRIVPDAGTIGFGASYGVDAQGRMYHVGLFGAVHRLGFSTAAGDGSDVISGEAGNDQIFAGAGDDLLVGDEGADILAGGLGNDRLGGGTGNDWMEGGAGRDWLSGGDGNDRLEGQAGDDVLEGQVGIDAMFGGVGNDTYFVDNTLDDVTENAGAGTDTILSSATYATRANVESLILTGAAAINAFGDNAANVIAGNDSANLIGGFGGNDWIEGRGGADWLSGGNAPDRLNGGDGADALQGQLGADILIGGAGADYFFYDSFHDSNPVEGVDTILDFQAGIDKLNLSAVRQTALDHVTISQAIGNSYIQVDIGGNGTPDMTIEVVGQTITLADILI